MNRKIFAELVKFSDNDPALITNEFIKYTFDVELSRKYDTLVEYANAIDDKCLERYFSTYWQSNLKKWKYSGLSLIEEINAMKPRSVLDVGCGYNEFKGKIHNLIGIDPYNDNADFKVGPMNFRTIQKFDVILCLGSVNFGGENKIIAEVGRCVSLLEDGGIMFFRVNPGLSHDTPESKWVEFFAWNVPFIIRLSEMFNLKILDIRDDTNSRKYFVYKKA